MKDFLTKLCIAVVITTAGLFLYDRYFKVELPIVEREVVTVTEMVRDTVWVERIDTIKRFVTLEGKTDTFVVEVPIEGAVYRDTVYLDGKAWQMDVTTTGFNTNVEGVRFESLMAERKRPWSLGIQVGVGVGSEGFTPYVGVGVQYRLFEW